jgi:LysR family transcriptional regulator, benzoate and cis,cis-muconate-responsive activator of ben and cat genes
MSGGDRHDAATRSAGAAPARSCERPDEPARNVLDPRLLRYFIGVAEELHFGRAARRLFVAQQPLSQAIRRLEAELGVQLFRRTSRRVELTAAGQVFIADARALVRRSADAVEAARRAARGETGTLAVGYGGGALHNLLPEVVRRLRASHPAVALRLVELGQPEIGAGIAAGDLNVGLVIPPVADPTLATEVVYREPVVLALPEEHPLATMREAVPLAAADAEPFVLYEGAPMPAARAAQEALCREAGFGPRVAQEAPTQGAVVSLVSAGLGVALVRASAAGMGLAGVVYRPLARPTLTVELAAAWRQADASPLVAAFVQTAREVARDVAEAAPTLEPSSDWRPSAGRSTPTWMKD